MLIRRTRISIMLVKLILRIDKKETIRKMSSQYFVYKAVVSYLELIYILEIMDLDCLT